ncbi:hypothetical protein KR222_005414, partial [Zaprionus bogoriensis]
LRIRSTMDTVKLLILSLVVCMALTVVRAIQFDPETSMTTEEYSRIMDLQSPLASAFAKYYGNITDIGMELPDSRLPSAQDLQCLADVALLMKGITDRNYWALKMIDSWGFIPKGILYGNIVDMGNYDECIGINQIIAESHKIQGKYCMINIPIRSALSSVMKIAVCFPSSCSAANMDTFLSQITNRLLNMTVTGSLVNPESCKTSDREPLDGLAIFTIVLLSVLGALVVLATLGDYFIYEDQKQLPIVVKAFSMRANSRKLFHIVQPKTNPNVIDCLNGMRCMSLIWVIFGHQYLVTVMIPKINYFKLYSWIEQPFSSFIFHGFFSVDTFFFLSGLLIVMIALRSMERYVLCMNYRQNSNPFFLLIRSKGRLNVPMMYLHRYLRLTPLLALGILVYMKILPLMTSGPVAEYVNFGDYTFCERTWYMTLLYVQNYATTEICLNHSWYLAVDMQLYILSPIFLYALYKWGKKAAAGIFVLMLLLSACLFSTMMIKKFPVYLEKGGMTDEAQRKIYYATHTHAAPWLIGLLFGYFLHLNRGRVFKLNRLFVWLGWIISLAMIFTSIFALYPAAQWKSRDLTMLEQTCYYTFTRIAWPLSLCWVVFACMQGYGGLANGFLSSPLWQPLTKLSYSAYIFHVFVQLINGRRVRTNEYLSDYDVMLSFWASFGFTMIMSYVMHIILEAPFGVLEGMLTPKPKAKPSPQPVQTKESPVKDTPEVEKMSTEEPA